ncbi:hypothetical protein CHS0354_043035 [Potamilus streckersoni]|uniref:DDE-1 domain-containing protein n=1 Tax=Potamilus streckersoni TaxID=2493646 RepID=A0AAE0SCL6_9BIVA|nr:hypothetical protein CHS0354_043035 [Potamilus streckersoni]
MACFNAAGGKMPSIHVMNTNMRKVIQDFYVAEAPSKTCCLVQQTVGRMLSWAWAGFSTSSSNPVDLMQRPQLLLMEGNSFHETLGLLECVQQENIHIVASPFTEPITCNFKREPTDVSISEEKNCHVQTNVQDHRLQLINENRNQQPGLLATDTELIQLVDKSATFDQMQASINELAT